MGFTFPGNPFANVAITTSIVMFLWIPVVFYIFMRFPPKRAIVIGVVLAWLYLPEATLSLPGLPDYSKVSATSYGALLATFFFYSGRFANFRFSWLDVPMLIWCLCPFASSLSNGLGAYDGFAATVEQIMTWGIPYFLGRIYISSLEGFRQLALGIFIGGLSYIPLCFFEIRFSPQLHRLVYGDGAFADFTQSIRFGGYRPTVFLRHGLAVGAFMMVATLAGIWLWKSGTLKKLWGIPIQWLVGALFITFVLVKSSGAYLLLAMGLGIFIVARQLHSALPVFLLIGAMAGYLYLNTQTDTYFTDQLVSVLSSIFPEDRIQSLEFRFNNEELLADKARERFWFGWAGYGRALVPLDNYGRVTVQDSLWIIAFGHNGIVGLISLFTAMLLPVTALFWSRYPARLWSNPKVAPVAAIAVAVTLYMVDCILNAMINPIYIFAVGGISGLALKPREKTQTAKRKAQRLVPAQQQLVQQ
ncbi:MAG: hypothetical protein Kow00121_25360 [Elainellaceae cyanobacterium]